MDACFFFFLWGPQVSYDFNSAPNKIFLRFYDPLFVTHSSFVAKKIGKIGSVAPKDHDFPKIPLKV